MEIKKMMTMMVAAVAIMIGVCSCGSDDDEPEVAVAAQVEGSYTGKEIILVMGDESSNGTVNYGFVKSSDNTVDMTIPESGMGPMSIPSLTVKNIPLVKTESNIMDKTKKAIMGKLSSYSGTVKNSQGEGKAYTVNNLTVVFSDNTVVVTFELKYGAMPFGMETTFTGTKK